MPMINITAECEEIIRENATLPFHQTAVRRPDGTFDVPVGDDTLEGIRKMQIAGETISDTILRGIRTMGGQKPN